MSADPRTPHARTPPLAVVAPADQHALPPGTRFGEFEIIRVLGVGGFGIVYLAQDHSLERQVALKEYMPATLAARGVVPMVTIRSSALAETYALGLRSFVNEARLLARFDHPSLVKVYRFWEDNGTAYMVMPYLNGRTLRDVRRSISESPKESWLRGVLDSMLDALEQLHREGVFHRDIAPDNILLPASGPPMLLDFGAARRVISDRTQSLTAILKPSYAPIEQYAEMTQLRQGPWTDLYALGAVMHYLVFGVPPAPSTARAVQPDAEQIEQRVVPGVSPRFMSAMAWMLGVRPLDRPQNVASLRAALNGEIPIPESVRREVTMPDRPVRMPTSADRTTQAFARTRADSETETVFDSTSPETLPVDAPETVPLRGSTTRTMPPTSRPRRTGTLWAGAFVAVTVAALVLWKFVGVIADRPIGATVAQAALAASEPQAAPGPLPSASVAPAAADLPAAVAEPVATSTSVEGATPIAVAVPIAAAVDASTSASSANQDVKAANAPPRARVRPAPPRETRVARETAQVEAANNRPATARDACGSRGFFALAMCLQRECSRPRFASDSECLRIRRDQERRASP